MGFSPEAHKITYFQHLNLRPSKNRQYWGQAIPGSGYGQIHDVVVGHFYES